jgi:glutamate 5-kinase
MNVSEKINQFISENGGNERDALNIALARLEAAEQVLLQISDADGAYSTNPLTHADNTICSMRNLAVDFLDKYSLFHKL